MIFAYGGSPLEKHHSAVIGLQYPRRNRKIILTLENNYIFVTFIDFIHYHRQQSWVLENALKPHKSWNKGFTLLLLYSFSTFPSSWFYAVWICTWKNWMEMPKILIKIILQGNHSTRKTKKWKIKHHCLRKPAQRWGEERGECEYGQSIHSVHIIVFLSGKQQRNAMDLVIEELLLQSCCTLLRIFA